MVASCHMTRETQDAIIDTSDLGDCKQISHCFVGSITIILLAPDQPFPLVLHPLRISLLLHNVDTAPQWRAENNKQQQQEQSK